MRVQRSLLTSNATRMVYAVGSAVVLQLYLDSLGATAFEVSLLEVLFWLGLLVSSPFWGALSDALGRRRVFLVLSSLFASGALALYTTTTSFMALYVVRFLFSVAAAAFPPVALSLFTVGRDDDDRGRDIGKYHLTRAAGFFVGWGGSGLLVDYVGYAGGFYILAGIGGISTLAALLITEEGAAHTVGFRTAMRDGIDRMVPDLREPLMRENGLHMLYVSIMLRKVAFIGIVSVVAVLLKNSIGIQASIIGLLLAINPLSQLIFLRSAQRLSDIAGRRSVFLVGIVLSLGYPLGLLVASGPLTAVAAFLLQGASFAAFVQSTTSHIGDTAPDDRQGELLGYRKSMQGLAGVIGPLLAGSIATLFSYSVMLWTMTGIILLSLIIGYHGVEESLRSADTRPLTPALVRKNLSLR